MEGEAEDVAEMETEEEEEEDEEEEENLDWLAPPPDMDLSSPQAQCKQLSRVLLKA